MHELSITRQIISMIDDECAKRGIRPKQARIEVGSMTTYRKEPILHYFNILRQENPDMKSCELVVDEVDAKIKCEECGLSRKLDNPVLVLCPVCESNNVEIIAGKDIKILEVVSDV